MKSEIINPVIFSNKKKSLLKTYVKHIKKHLNNNQKASLKFSNTENTDLLHHLLIKNKIFVNTRIKHRNYITYTLSRINFKSKMQEYIYNSSYAFRFKGQAHLFKDKNVLHVGVGLGFFSYFISLFAKSIVNLDIHKDKNSIIKDIEIYNGKTIPHTDNAFDLVTCIYTLHHAKHPKELFNEIIRVSKKRIFLAEGTYAGDISKLSLMLRDIKVNFLAKQGILIHPNNYFKKGELGEIISKKGLQIEAHNSKKKLRYYKETFILSKGN